MKYEFTKISASMKFFYLTVILFFLVLIIDSALARSALKATLAMFYQVLPALLIAFAINLAINFFISDDFLHKHMGEGSGVKGYVLAIISGILIGGPPFLLLPMLGDLKCQGMRPALIATFLFNRNVKIPFIPIMIYYFGLSYTIAVSILLIVFSVLNGILVERLIGEKNNA